MITCMYSNRLFFLCCLLHPVASLKGLKGDIGENNSIVVLLATYHFARWEHTGKSAGIKFNWSNHFCHFSSASAVLIIITERHCRHLRGSRWLSNNFLSECVGAAFDFYALAELIKLMFLSLSNATPTVPLQPSTSKWLLKKTKKKNGDVSPACVQESWLFGLRVLVRLNPTCVLLIRTYNGFHSSISSPALCLYSSDKQLSVFLHPLVWFVLSSKSLMHLLKCFVTPLPCIFIMRQ